MAQGRTGSIDTDKGTARDQAIAGGTGDGRHHLRHLDGLRGVAILMVVMIHVGLFVPGLPPRVADLTFYGLHGVQLFFIVSGLTLTIAHAGAPLRLADFAARRFFRIAPAFYLGAALYVALGRWTALRFAPHDVQVGEIAATLLFLHGWLPHVCNKVVPGGWSIAAEAMFYILFPLLLRQVGRPRRLAAIVTLTYVVAGATNLLLKHRFAGDPAAEGFAFYFWLCQLPAFALGCWLATGPGYDRVSPRAAGWLLLVAVMLLVADSQLRHLTNLLVSITLLGLLAWAAGRARPRWLTARPLVFTGRISFSLYLLHFAVLALIGPAVARMELAWWAMLPLLYLLVLLLGMPLAWGSFTAVERPFIALGRSLFARAAPARPAG